MAIIISAYLFLQFHRIYQRFLPLLKGRKRSRKAFELKYTATHEQVMKDIKDFEEYILDRNFKNTYLIHASEEDKLILDSINVK